MGMFDTIHFNCPNCGKRIEAQSKSGPCSLGMHNNQSVPLEVAIDANGHAPYKCDCGKEWIFDTRVTENVVFLPVIPFNTEKSERLGRLGQ